MTYRRILAQLVLGSVLVGSVGMLGCQKKEAQSGPTLEERVTALEQRVEGLEQRAGEIQSTEEKSPATLANKPYNRFTDLADVGAKEMIEDLAKLGMFEEYDDKFEPFKLVTRAEYMKWLYEANNMMVADANKLRLAPQLSPQFKDLAPSHPAYKYVQALANAGYSVGYDDGTFKPDQPITREEMIGIKVGLDKGKSIQPDRGMMNYVWKFSDGSKIDERFTGYMYWDYHSSGPKGTNIQRAFGQIGTFKPKEPVTRAEAAATLWQIGGTTAVNALEAQASQ